MKGFPNQFTEFSKITAGIARLAVLVDAGEDAKDDGIFGEALVRIGVAGTGHKPLPIEAYLAQQRKNKVSRQSFRTTARGLRELYRLMGLIDDSEREIEITALGRQAAAFEGKPMDAVQTQFWRGIVGNIEHAGGGSISHPYQVLLRLVARKPGITRAKCALALEARDDTPAELDRIVRLVDSEEAAILRAIGATTSNWNNAKKVLPKFAEQLRDVIRTGHSFVLADAPGRADEGQAAGTQRLAGTRAPRSSREVSSETIARAGTAERNDEEFTPPAPNLDPAAVAAAIKSRGARLRRHNAIVRALAALFEAAEGRMYEDPFDILGRVDGLSQA